MRGFILNHLNEIYYIGLLTMKEFIYPFFFSILLIILFFATISFFIKTVK